MSTVRNLVIAGIAALLLAAQPARAQDSIEKDLTMIYQGIYSLYDKAEQGDAKAAFIVASLHLNGIFLPADTEAGLKFLKIAADKEDPDGLYYLGLHHHHGMYDLEVDKEMASAMIKKAAELGHPAAALALQHLQ
ncbi:MAG: tetratricopeptide repeat protein [Propylenella sp.]